MPSGQVSVWVPIVVGVIGLVGVVAGQLVSAWREDRRWQREQEREDQRWRRESRQEATKLDREVKVATYGRLIYALDDAELALSRLRDRGGDPATNTKNYLGAVEEVRVRAAEVRLVCSLEMFKHLHQQVTDLVLLPAMMEGIDVSRLAVGPALEAVTPDKAMTVLKEFRQGVLVIARRELGVDVTD